MVKHGRNKKRRAGRIGRTKLKNNGNWKTWNPNPKISDSTVKRLWNVKKTPNQNLASMGLTMNVNGPDPNTINTDSVNDNNMKKPNMIELFDIPESDEHAGKSRRVPLQKEEQEYMVQCLEKYGTNYTQMFRDTKLNYLQHTEGKLRKLGARFLLLEQDQLLVDTEDIPETVQKMMMESSASGGGGGGGDTSNSNEPNASDE